jgi:hypothetical protein
MTSGGFTTEAIYLTYILPLLEYACELWDDLMFFFFDESEVVPIQFRNKAIPN